MLKPFIFILALSLHLFSAIPNSKTIVLSTLSNEENAHAFIDTHLKEVKEPLYILKSHRGFYVVTYKSFNQKETLKSELSSLPQRLKKFHPFAYEARIDLTQKHSDIIYSSNILVSIKEQIIEPKIEKIKQPVVKEVVIPKTKSKTTQQQVTTKKAPKIIHSFSFGYGQDKQNNATYRLGIQRKFEKRYFESNTGYVSGFYDVSVNKFDVDSSLYSLNISPVFAYYFKTNTKVTPFVYGGIGTSFFSKTSTKKKKFSTSFQFEDRFGLGVKTKEHSFDLGYYHYSNASIKKPNDGIDMFLLSYLHSF